MRNEEMTPEEQEEIQERIRRPKRDGDIYELKKRKKDKKKSRVFYPQI